MQSIETHPYTQGLTAHSLGVLRGGVQLLMLLLPAVNHHSTQLRAFHGNVVIVVSFCNKLEEAREITGGVCENAVRPEFFMLSHFWCPFSTGGTVFVHFTADKHSCYNSLNPGCGIFCSSSHPCSSIPLKGWFSRSRRLQLMGKYRLGGWKACVQERAHMTVSAGSLLINSFVFSVIMLLSFSTLSSPRLLSVLINRVIFQLNYVKAALGAAVIMSDRRRGRKRICQMD